MSFQLLKLIHINCTCCYQSYTGWLSTADATASTQSYTVKQSLDNIKQIAIYLFQDFQLDQMVDN